MKNKCKHIRYDEGSLLSISKTYFSLHAICCNCGQELILKNIIMEKLLLLKRNKENIMESAPTNRPVNLVIVILAGIVIILGSSLVIFNLTKEIGKVIKKTPVVTVTQVPVQKSVEKINRPVEVSKTPSSLNHGIFIKGNSNPNVK